MALQGCAGLLLFYARILSGVDSCQEAGSAKIEKAADWQKRKKREEQLI